MARMAFKTLSTLQQTGLEIDHVLAKNIQFRNHKHPGNVQMSRSEHRVLSPQTQQG